MDRHTSPEPLGLLVVGSGPAGVSAATAYVEAGGAGAVCVLSDDTEPPYQRPPLSKGFLAGTEAAEPTPIMEDDALLSRVQVRLGARVDFLDLEAGAVRTVLGEEFRYHRLVLATGSTPKALPGADSGATVFTLRSLQDARRLLAAARGAGSAVVVGSGFIGCEAAASLAGRGLQTTLVTPERAPQAARLGEWAGERIAGWLAESGVELRMGVEVAVVESPSRVHLGDGSQIDADLVLAAVGVTQTRAFLVNSSLRLQEGRVLVDEELRTSDPRVWAAGDVALARHAVAGRALRVEHWGDSMTMGELAGRNAAAQRLEGAGDAGVWSAAPGFWTEIGKHTLKYAAWGDGFIEARVVEDGDGAFTVWYAGAAGELVGVLTHERDDDYQRGGDLLGRRASLAEALRYHEGGSA